MHARAATVVVEQSARFEHRMAAAEQYDEGLADAMKDYAAQLYQQHSFRLAAQYLRWSSILTPDPGTKEFARARMRGGRFLDVLGGDDGRLIQPNIEKFGAAVPAGLTLWGRSEGAG